MSNETLNVEQDFEYLLSFLPAGWREKAKALGALERRRKVPDAETLLRVLLMHLADGCSLRETALRARRGGVAQLSDVAIMDRLSGAGEWFRWMNGQILSRWVRPAPPAVFGAQYNVRLVDATRVKEPGPTGSSWCIHYSIALPSLCCQEVFVSDVGESGESFSRFEVRPGDLFVGDEVYGVRPGIEHVLRGQGHVLTRFAPSNLPLVGPSGQALNLLARLRRLAARQVGDWPVLVRDAQSVAGRVCAIRKSPQAAQRARQRTVRHARKSGYQASKEALEANDWVFVFTTVAPERMTALHALEIYRGRWQIEMIFKHLKSILSLGHLKKIDPRGARAWLQGKLFVAFLVEMLIVHAESFFPWGYPLCETPPREPLPVA